MPPGRIGRADMDILRKNKEARREKAFVSDLWGCRLVYGNFMDRAACCGEKGLSSDRAVVPVDVSNLWDGSLYRSFVQALEKLSRLCEGKYLYGRNFCSRTGQREHSQTFSCMSLGLQQKPCQLSGIDSSGLRSGMVCSGTFF